MDLTAVEDVLAVVERILGGKGVLDEAVCLVVLCSIVVEHISDTLVGVSRDPWVIVQRVEVPRE